MNMFSGMKGRALQGTLARSYCVKMPPGSAERLKGLRRETEYDEEFFFSTRLKARPRSTEEELFDEITRYEMSNPENYR